MSEMEFTSISFPAFGGPEDGEAIEGKGMKCEDGGIAWPSVMFTATGHFYQLIFDENDQPTHFEYKAERNRVSE